MNIHWIAGFINADGGFYLSITSSKTHALGEAYHPSINIGQHIRSVIVL